MNHKQDLPWTDTAAFRAALPAFSDMSQALPSSIAEYRQFYSLEFDIPHTYHIGCFQSQEYTLVGQIFTPENPKGTLFVYHGYFDHLGLYRFAIQLGLQLGLTVVGFDLPGHGLSSGPSASIDCFSRYAIAQKKFVQQVESFGVAIAPRRWSALGQSTGAAVILDSLLEANRYTISAGHYDGGLVFLAPLIRPWNWHWVRILYQVLRHRGSTPRTFSINSSDPEFCHFLSALDPLQHRRIEAAWVGAMIRYAKRIVKAAPSSHSLCIIQGTADTTVAYTYNLRELKRLFQQHEVVMLDGARHHLVNESQEHQEMMFDSIQQYLSRHM